VWVACAHWNHSDPGLRGVIIDPYGQVVAASDFQQDGVIHHDIALDRQRVYYAGLMPEQGEPGESGTGAYQLGNLPEQREGWRDMIFAARRPELYGIIPTVNEVIMRYRAEKCPFGKTGG